MEKVNQAVILAAGKGTRLGHLTQNKPKCLLEFLGKSLLQRQVDNFRLSGINNIIVVAGYMHDTIDLSGVELIVNERYETTNMVESLFCSRDYWKGDVVVSYGDIVYELTILQKLLAAEGPFSVAVDNNAVTLFRERFGDDFLNKMESLILSDDGAIVDIGRPDPLLNDVQAQYIGLMKFTAQGLQALSKLYDRTEEEDLSNAYMTDLLQRAIEGGCRLDAVRIDGGWLEFDTVGDYEKYNELYREHKLNAFYDSDQ